MTNDRDRGYKNRHYSVIYTYHEVLEHLYKTGIGNRTRFNTKVTQRLINNVLARLNQLKNNTNNSIIERLMNEKR